MTSGDNKYYTYSSLKSNEECLKMRSVRRDLIIIMKPSSQPVEIQSFKRGMIESSSV